MKTNKKAGIIWDEFRFQRVFTELIGKYRFVLGIPPAGFTTVEEMNAWESYAMKKAKLDQQFEKKNIADWHAMWTDMENIFPSRYLFLFGSFHVAIFRFLLWGEANPNDIDTSGCSIFLVLPSHKTYGDISAGIYLQIGQDTPIRELRNYIDKNKREIRNYQDKLRRATGTNKKVVARSNRDWSVTMFVYEMGKMSKPELEERFEMTARYKDKLIADIITSNGYKISSVSVHKILAEERKKRRDAGRLER